MSIKSLSDKQKLVLYGLVKYPSLTDNEVCNILNLKKSTYSTIKKKFKELGFYEIVKAPIFQHIGCELLIVVYGTLNRRTTIEDRLAISKKYFEKFHEYFYIISESNQAINLAISKNITEFERNFEEFIQIYESYEFLDEKGFKYVLFPFDMISIFNFFDYAPILNRLFDLGFRDSPNYPNLSSDKIKGKVMDRRLTEKEKKVFYGLVTYPDLPDNRIAEKIKTTRFTVTKIRKRFYEEKLMRTTCIPDVKKLGMNILAFTHAKFKPNLTTFKKNQCLEDTLSIYPTIFNVARDLENLSISIFKNYRDFQETQELINKCRVENEFLKSEPESMLLSIPRMTKIKNHTYAPLTKKILGI
jgi:DNA-binding MarR family transcriptional regulator